MKFRLVRARRAPRMWGLLAATFWGCGDGAASPAGGPAAEQCPAENQAPLRNGPGAARPFECVVVGAITTGGAAEWPAVDTLPSPRIFVSARATAGGDGTRERPFSSLAPGAAALAAGGGSLVLARGEYPMTATLVLAPGVTLVGAGAGATTLVAPRGRAAVDLPAGSGAVKSLAIRFVEGTLTDDDVGVAARAGTALALDDVWIDRATTGVQADGATVTGTRVTAMRPYVAGVYLRSGSRGVFSLLWVHHGEGIGVHATDSVVHLGDSMITCNGIAGLTVTGVPPAMGGAASCAGDLSAPTGDTMCWSRVVFNENKLQSVNVAVCRESSAACLGSAGRLQVEARLLSVRATAQRDGRGGDGISVGPHTRLSLDPEATGMAAGSGGSAVSANARAGVLVAGPDAVVTIHGTMIADNRGPGVYLQGAARVDALHDTVVRGNTGLGLGVTPSSSLGVVMRSEFLATRVGALPLASGGTVTFGDGLALSQRTGFELTANTFSDNQRYAAFMTGVDMATITGNRGANNRYGLTAYVSRVDPTVGNAVLAREGAPASPPAVLTESAMAP